MPSYHKLNSGIYKFASDFVPLNPCDIKLLGAIACRYTWSPIVFKDQYRNKINFLYSEFTAFDVDNNGHEQYPLGQAIVDWMDSEVIIATTKSHQLPKTTANTTYPPADRFRIITRWARRIESLEEYEYNMRRIVKHNEHFDGSCVDGARPFYPCTRIVFHNFSGYPQPVHQVIKEKKNMYAVANTFFSDNPNKISNHVDMFIKKGIPFGEGRNISVYVSTLELLKASVDPEKVLELLRASPFDRREFSDHELESTYASALKAFADS